VIDGPDRNYVGTPLPFQSDLHISSGAAEIYVGPLLIDLALYCLAASWLVWLWRRLPVQKYLNSVLSAVIWLAGGALVAVTIMVWSMLDTFFELWFDPTIYERVLSVSWRGY
jgi:hypothetical protein